MEKIMALTDGWTAAQKRAGVRQTNEKGLGGPGVSSPGYSFRGTPSTQNTAGANQDYINQQNAYAAQQEAQAAEQRKIDYINAQFNAQKAQYNSQLRALDPQRDAAEGRILNQYTTRSNDLKADYAKGQRNLTTSRNTIVGERERGLDSIRRQLQQQAMSYGNQLGAYGAGDSSAAELINTAIAGGAAKNRGNLLTNTSQQLTSVDTQEKDLEDSFNRNVRDLGVWKQQTLSDIADRFLAQKQKIQVALQTADAQRANQLAQLDENLTNEAIAKLNQLEALYNRQANQLVARYRNALAPSNIKIDEALQDYEVKPISAGQLSAIETPEPVQSEDPLAAILRRREEEELAAGPLNY